MPGNVIFKPIQANLLHNTDWLTKMNPYCAFVVGEQRIKSEVCRKGGKHPHWTDAITIPVSNESEIRVELMDKDRFTHDDQIGSFSISLPEIESQGQVSRWYPLFFKDKLAGEILMEASFEGSTMIAEAPQEIIEQRPVEVIEENRRGILPEQPVDTRSRTDIQAQETITESVYVPQKNFISQQQNLITQDQNVAQQNLVTQQQMISENVVNQATLQEESHRVFVEQHQVVEPHTFLKEVDVVETKPVLKQIEVLEPHKVLKEVQYTEAVPVKKQIETVEPHVILKDVEVIEPRLITKEIQIIENVPVMKHVEVIESVPVIKEIETFEPQTFTKTVEVTEQVPVKKQVTVTEPVHFKKAVEFVEPIITTQTITKEIQPAVVIDEYIKKEIGPASVIDIDTNLRQTAYSTTYMDTALETRRSEQELFARESMARHLYGSQYYDYGNISNQLSNQSSAQKKVEPASK